MRSCSHTCISTMWPISSRSGSRTRFGLASEWKPPALYAPPGGEARLAALCEASGHGADHLTACGLTVGEYDPAAARHRRRASHVP